MDERVAPLTAEALLGSHADSRSAALGARKLVRPGRARVFLCFLEKTVEVGEGLPEPSPGVGDLAGLLLQQAAPGRAILE